MSRDARDRGAANGARAMSQRATETILSVAARCVLSGSDGVTAREVADALTKLTCARSRASLVDGDVDHARERSAYEALREACARDGARRVDVEDERERDETERRGARAGGSAVAGGDARDDI